MREEGSSGTATVLFTDLVGSTDLLVRLGDDAFDEVRRRYFAMLRAALVRHSGKEIKTLGDGILAVFGSASAAVAAAVVMQQGADEQARRSQSPLVLRVGIALGDVAFEEGDVFGGPVVEAARLVEAAGPGQILVTSVVRAAASRVHTGFTERGSLHLKGLPEPVTAYEVSWAPRAEVGVPLSALLTGMGRVFVGREGELDRLEHLWKQAFAGELQIVFLAGEPGVGKTRLAAELARRLQGEGSVLAGACAEDLGVPYQPFVEALRHQVDHTAAEELAGSLGRYPGELVRLVPELAERLPDLPPPLASDPETVRYRLFDAVAAWLAGAARDRPLLLVLDDLQWAAKPTLLLLRHVARYPGPLRLLVLGTYRDTEIGRDHPLGEALADLRRRAGFTRLSLAGFDRAGVLAYMEEAAGHTLDDDDALALAVAIHQETEGNPFFVKEVLRHLTETGALRRHEGRWTTGLPLDELGIPEGVRDVVGRRLSRLSPATNQMLTVAAVIGGDFEPAVLRLAAGSSEDTLVAAMDEAVRSRLVIDVSGPRDRYRFAHALVRDTLYDELSGARRVALHRRAAEAIEAVHGSHLDDYLPALAHHCARASAPAADVGRAADYATRAGDRALAQFANDEAVTYYHQALEILEAAEAGADERRRLELLIALGEAQRRAGNPAFGDTLFGAAALARALGDPIGLAQAALANNRGAGVYTALGVVDHDRVTLLETALDALEPEDSPLRAQLLARLGTELIFDANRERRTALSDEALAMGRRVGDSAVLTHILQNRFFTIGGPDTLEEQVRVVAELASLAEPSGDPVRTCWASIYGVRTALALGDPEEAEHHQELLTEVTEDLGQPQLRLFAVHHATGIALVRGDVEAAEGCTDAYRALGESCGDPDTDLWFAIQRFWVRYEQGDVLGEAAPLLADASERCPRLPLLATLLAWLYCETGRSQEARTVWGRTRDQVGADLPVNHLWSMTVTAGAAVSAALGDRERAEALYRLLVPYGEHRVFAMGVSSGSVFHYLAILAAALGVYDEADARFADADTAHAQTPTWRARTRLEWARMLIARHRHDDRARARSLLEAARGEFEARGIPGWVRRIDAVLRPAPPSRGRRVGGLTDREAEVLGLVATGKSNKAIAAELHLSPKTVDRHLSNIFAKLGVNSRAAATSFAHRQGII